MATKSLAPKPSKASPELATDAKAAQFTALIGLEDLIRKLAMLARLTADKVIELEIDHSRLSPEALEAEKRNVNDAMCLACMVQERAEDLARAFEKTWRTAS